jgi:hypothetical protein
MALTDSQSLGKAYTLFFAKSFLVWAFTLTVCSLVIGFPILILVVTVGSLLAVSLQAVLPMSAVLVVASGIFSLHIVGILAASALLTLRGIHPQDVSWLTWLNGRENTHTISVYASCPLTCDIQQT